MRPHLAAALLGAALAGQTADPAVWRASLDRHLAAVGRAVPPFLVVRAAIHDGGARLPVTTYVRAQPFGFRRDVFDAAGKPRGKWITDGRYAWDANGALLEPAAARLCLELAFVDGLLYRLGNRLTGGPDTAAPWPLRDHENLPADCPRNLQTHWVGLLSPAGTMLQFHFDARDGLLVEVAVADVPPAPTWTRLLDWREHGGIRLPMRQFAGVVGSPALIDYRVESVELPASMPDGLFAGAPPGTVAGEIDAGPLLLVAGAVPGTTVLLAPIELEGFAAAIGVLDTGATRSGVTPVLATAVGLAPRSAIGVTTLTAKVEMQTAWLHRLALGQYTMHQFTVTASQLPAVVGQPFDRQPGVLVGTDVLFAGSPVFDLRGARLRLRGSPVAPLSATAVGPVVTMPLRRDRGSLLVEVRVGDRNVTALLDTGMPFAMRLDDRALTELGLPATAAGWQAAGALPLDGAEAGGRSTPGYIAELPVIEFGDGPRVRLEWADVQFSEVDAAHPEIGSFLGMGALRGFARIGIDLERAVLELELPAGTAAAPDGAFVIADPGRFSGCVLQVPPSAARDGRIMLPRIGHVVPGSIAERAGLRVGDLLARIDGEACGALPAAELHRLLWLRPGTAVVLDLFDVVADKPRRREVRLVGEPR
ncbi:MAG: aspartyl protease family protein [Planctomycetota bacterium]